jgi:hypothetical protein
VGPRRQGPQGPGAGPLGAYDTNQGLPGGPHGLRPATADDIGGRPGAVNSNTNSSGERTITFNASDHHSSPFGYRPSH